jgi:hypothetical protein
MHRVEIRGAIENSLLHLPPITLGAVPLTKRTPDHYAIIYDGDTAILRLDLYSDEPGWDNTRIQVTVWNELLIVAWYNRLATVCLSTQAVTEREWWLGANLKFFQNDDHLLAVSGGSLTRIVENGGIAWDSDSWDWVGQESIIETLQMEDDQVRLILRDGKTEIRTLVKVDLESGKAIKVE